MTRIDVDLNEDIISILNKLQNINDIGIDLHVPVGARIFDNILNLKLLKKELEKNGRVLHFTTEDEAGNTLISMLDNDTSTNFMPEDFGNLNLSPSANIFSKSASFLGNLLSNVKLPLMGKKVFLVILLAIILGGFALYKITNSRRAQIKIVVDSQLLARSVSIKVRNDVDSDAEQKILKGKTVSTVLIEKSEINTTGEKLVGDKAEGKITVFNKTPNEVTLKSGSEVVYKGGDDDLSYVLKKSVTIPPIYERDPTDPASVLVPGEAEVDIEASDIGDVYNIDGDETLEINDYKKADLVSKTLDDVTGGKSELKKIVSEQDKADLSGSILAQVKETAEPSLKKELSKGQSLIAGSLAISVQKENYNHEVGDEAEKLELVQEVLVSGLIYSEEDLVSLLNNLIDKSVPEEYVISDEDREINVEVLGNTDSSVLSSTEADLQVTVKTFVVPNISVEDLKDKLKGKNSGGAQKIIGSIRAINTYELNILGGFPVFKKIPKDLNKISLEIVKANE